MKSLEGVEGLEGLEGFGGLQGLQGLERQYWAFCCFFRVLTFKNSETQKQDQKKTDIFLVTNPSDSYLALRLVYLNSISYITMSIIVNNLH